MSGDEDKRAFVLAMYPGPNWKKKVRGMSDAQVFAIWAKAHDTTEPPQRGSNNNHDEPF